MVTNNNTSENPWYQYQLSEAVNLLANRTLPEAAIPVDSEIGFEVKALKVFAVVASRRQRDPLARDRTSGDEQKIIYDKAILFTKMGFKLAKHESLQLKT